MGRTSGKQYSACSDANLQPLTSWARVITDYSHFLFARSLGFNHVGKIHWMHTEVHALDLMNLMQGFLLCFCHGVYSHAASTKARGEPALAFSKIAPNLGAWLCGPHAPRLGLQAALKDVEGSSGIISLAEGWPLSSHMWLLRAPMATYASDAACPVGMLDWG